MKLKHRQNGITLFIALIFLLVMTLFAVSSINISSGNLKIVGNMQSIKLMEALASDAIEQMLSDSSHYGNSAAASTITVKYMTADATEQTLDVTIDKPTCIDKMTATGYSIAQEAIIPEDTTWEVVAHVQDPVTGAKVVIHQGFGMRMLMNNCPDPS